MLSYVSFYQNIKRFPKGHFLGPDVFYLIRTDSTFINNSYERKELHLPPPENYALDEEISL